MGRSKVCGWGGVGIGWASVAAAAGARRRSVIPGAAHGEALIAEWPFREWRSGLETGYPAKRPCKNDCNCAERNNGRRRNAQRGKYQRVGLSEYISRPELKGRAIGRLRAEGTARRLYFTIN